MENLIAIAIALVLAIAAIEYVAVYKLYHLLRVKSILDQINEDIKRAEKGIEQGTYPEVNQYYISGLQKAKKIVRKELG